MFYEQIESCNDNMQSLSGIVMKLYIKNQENESPTIKYKPLIDVNWETVKEFIPI